MELSARVSKLCEKYDMKPEDVAFADLMLAGWSKFEAAYYAYNLAYFDFNKIKAWLKDKSKITPGVDRMVEDVTKSRKEEEKKYKDALKKVSAKTKKAEAESEKNKINVEEALRSKSGMLETLIDLASTPGLDVKLKADLLKQITDLQNYKKEDIKEDDNRTRFYLPLTCSKCSLYQEFKKTRHNNDNENQNNTD